MRIFVIFIFSFGFISASAQFTKYDERNFKERFRAYYFDLRLEAFTSLKTQLYGDFSIYNETNYNYKFIASHGKELPDGKRKYHGSIGTYFQIASFDDGDNDRLGLSTPFDSDDTTLFAYQIHEFSVKNLGFYVSCEILIVNGLIFEPIVKTGLVGGVVDYNRRRFGADEKFASEKSRSIDYLDTGAGFNIKVIFSQKFGFTLNYLFHHPLFLQKSDTGEGPGDDNIGTKLSFYDINFGLYFNIVKE